MSASTELDDTTLLQRCRASDSGAWEVLVRRYERVVYAIARHAGLDEQLAADVFQTVFLRLLQHLPRIHEPAALLAWLITTTKREAWLQRQRGRRFVSTTVVDGAEGEWRPETQLAEADEALGPEATVEHWQQLARVQAGLQRLDQRCQDLLRTLFQQSEPAYGEVATQLGMPVGSIGPTRARCLAKLRGLVE